MPARFPLHYASAAVALALSGTALAQSAAEGAAVHEMATVQVIGTAEEEVKESLGVSVITADEIARRPPANDLSDIIRREPGVNLTGNSASGNRGNQRQIDIRGMGPENTLILIDGVPSSSRNSVRYGWNGDRDTRGETNWVPAEEVERIEVIRGPAAARYGSGAMGGVINIITKRPTDRLSGSLTYYGIRPEDPKEGDGNRVNFRLSGPASDTVSFRLYGNYGKTDPDALDINAGNARSGLVAGREGLVNKDVNGLLSWKLTPDQTLDLSAGYSRQGNRYAGDTMLSNGDAYIESLYDSETNVMARSNFALTHRGTFDWGSSRATLAYDYTRNSRMNEGMAGGGEGAISEGAGWATSRLKNLRADGEVNVPLALLGLEQVATVGAEFLRESLEDPGSMRAQSYDGALEGFTRGDPKRSVNSYALFIEDNVEVGTRTMVTPGLRYDHHADFGGNWSPSLNASYKVLDALTLKGGIARAYKAPNLYQSNPGYMLYSMGNGCNQAEANSGGCYLVGNSGLRPETSVNKEIGLAWDAGTWRASAAYFRNDYDNKITAGNELSYRQGDGRRVYQWINSGEAVVQGVEGNLFLPLTAALDWNTNFTYMIESESKEDGEPLSVIPEYTLNSTLDWRATERLSLQAILTWYGKQESPRRDRRTATGIDDEAQRDISPYAIAGLSATYVVNKNLRFLVGVSNLFDKRIYREGSANAAGAFTYNEPGRAYYASMTTSF